MTVSILGILNITEDSFSDGARYLAPDAAIAHGEALARGGADIIDLGAASSNPDAKPVAPEDEIARLVPVVAALKRSGIALSIDTFAAPVQRWALEQDVEYLNDIHGFPHPEIYESLAKSRCKLIVMHAVQEMGRADRVRIEPSEIFDRVAHFFGRRIADLTAAGIARSRLILDPGMGFFLGSEAQASYEILRRLPALKAIFSLPLLVSVSRKSFLRRLTGKPPQEAGAASLAAELFAAGQGADYIRTHEPGPLRDGLRVQAALRQGAPLEA